VRASRTFAFANGSGRATYEQSQAINEHIPSFRDQFVATYERGSSVVL
jgi:hypothetical protein